MKRNPLNSRFARDLRDDLGKYAVIALLMIFTIGFISGFLVADGSMIKAYNESFTKYNVEDGNFRTQKKMNKAQWKSVEELGVSLYENFYREVQLENGSTLRIFSDREDVNLVCLMEGSLPAAPGEIAIDRMYADNNGLKVGDRIRPAAGGAQDGWLITGLVALPDYSTMFSDNNDTMFDAILFGVAVCCKEEFAGYPQKELYFNYSWKYNDPPATEEEENERGEDLMKDMSREVTLENYIPRYANQAIRFTGEDMGSDRAMMQLLLYIMIGIIAFVFGVTTSNTISKEAPVIGTLRAMGFTKGELVWHYMAMPFLVTLISALIGNILGYTVLKDVCAGMYYNSYSLPTYVTIWNADAFVQTTAVPILIMAVITWATLRYSLGLSPLRFLRRDLSRRRTKKAFPLSSVIPFFDRFRMRIIAQNMPSYLILLVGIFFANILLIFGLALPQALDHYQEVIKNNLIANNQYILQIPLDALDEEHKLRSTLKMIQFSNDVETENETAEKFSAYTLRTPVDGPYRSEDIMMYGIAADSRYVKGVPGRDADDGVPGVLISSAYSDKYDIFAGDSIELESLTKVTRQLDVSMGSMMYLVDFFAVGIFMVLIYILSKIIIEKNAQSISMAKILGYSGSEIGRLYIRSTTVVYLIFFAATLPCVTVLIRFLMKIMIRMEMTGWIELYVGSKVYVQMAALGVLSYVVVAMFEYKKIGRVPMDETLKNAE